MSLRADPTEDGSAFILNGEKLWCTNLIKAGVLVVMAKTAPKIVNGKERKQITAFIVDVDSPGLEITYRCRFMGLRALYNGIVKFTNVRVPRENMIAKEGAGSESRAHDPEYRATDNSRGMRRIIQTPTRNLPQMGERTSSMGRADRQTRRHRRENRRDGGQCFCDGSDDVSDFVSGRSQGRRSPHRNRDVQNVGDRNDLEDGR